MAPRSLAALVGAVGALTGCMLFAGGPGPQERGLAAASPAPSASPDPGVSLLPAGSSDGPILARPRNGGRLEVDLAATAGRRDVVLSLIGPDLAYTRAEAGTKVVFHSLATGSYLLLAEGESRPSARRSVEIKELRATVSVAVDLPAEAAVVSGIVRDAQGKPLAGARVGNGATWRLTGADGQYAIAASPLEVHKTGFATATASGGDVRLAARPLFVSFENDPFGADRSTAFKSAANRMRALGWTVGNNLETADVRVVAAPAATIGTSADALGRFVRDGGKLVVTGDWGGAGAFSPSALNKVLLPLGAAIGQDLIRHAGSSPEWLRLAPEQLAAGLAQDVRAVLLPWSATTWAVPPFQDLAGAPGGSYRVQAAAARAVVSARAVGPGLVVVVGDTSAWLDPDGISREDNARFFENVLRH
ncbi:MAG: carboxypeptidase regulatory-like domain-containing protein [Candidatus Sericytochromatia bacterium]|nr:carboxypeptidase regulatory-like domain-containing protein [Candidatus Tanganyikabacteria bacterium]